MVAGAVPDPQFGTRLVFSEAWVSNVSSGLNDAHLEYMRTNAGFTANVTNGISFQITSALSAGAYADGMRMRPRIYRNYVNNDIEGLMLFTSIAGGGVEQFLEFGIRGNAVAATRDSNYYFVEIQYLANSIALWRCNATTFTQIASGAQTWTAADYWVRFVAIGNHFWVRTWLATVVEPNTWHVDFVDTTPIQGNITGDFTFGLNGGNSGTVTWTQVVKEVHFWEIGKKHRALQRSM